MNMQNLMAQAQRMQRDIMKKKEEVEVKNNAESLIYSSQKTLDELGDKISGEEKAKVETEIENVKKARNTVKENMPIDIIAIFIKDILEDLGNITGEVVTDDIINEIFSKFCLGK